MRLEEVIMNYKFRYSEVKEKSKIKLYNEGDYDISFIVPVRGRVDFLPVLYDAFKKAVLKSEKKICFIVSEIDSETKHEEFCKANQINHIFIECEKDELFNKCLAMNCATLWGHQAEYWLFHDVDCIMQSDFFNNIFLNLERVNTNVAQTFVDRRVLYCNEELTQEVIKKGFDYDTLKLDHETVTLPKFVGAPGGSIIIHQKLFEQVGMYDHIFFQANSPEDAMMWKKIEVFSEIALCEHPVNELFHFNHPVTYNSNPKERFMKDLYSQFHTKPKTQKENFIKLIHQKLAQWRS